MKRKRTLDARRRTLLRAAYLEDEAADALDAAEERVHYAEGTTELAMKHRDAAEIKLAAAEAEIARLKEALEGVALLDEADGHELERDHAFRAVAIATRALGKDPSSIFAARHAAQPPAVAEDVVERIKRLLWKYPGEMRVREEPDLERPIPRYFVDYLGTNEPVGLEIAGYLEKDMALLIAALFNYASANLLKE